jgi:hypothetical protein
MAWKGSGREINLLHLALPHILRLNSLMLRQVRVQDEAAIYDVMTRGNRLVECEGRET